VRFFTPANPGHAGTLVGELISLASSQSPLRLAVRKTAVAIPVSVRGSGTKMIPLSNFVSRVPALRTRRQTITMPPQPRQGGIKI
jgi:hypothetical protein